MRRGLAGLILGLSLVLASVSWAGFVMTRTVLDPGRSERLAEQVFENEQLRDALSDRLAAGLEAAIPAEIEIPPELLSSAADLALDDPAVQALVKDGIVATHRNALEGNTEPLTIDASALGSALRNALITLSPELEPVIPPVPPVEVTLPTGRLSFLGTIRNFVERTTAITGAIALVGAATALLLTTDRPGVLRRVAFWALGAAAFWMVVGFGIPWLASKLAPSSDAIIAAVIDVFFGAMIPPAITMALVGAALFGASLIWGAAGTRQPAAAQSQVANNQPAQRQQPASQRAGVASNMRPVQPEPTPQRHPPQATGQDPVSYQQQPAQHPQQQPARQQPAQPYFGSQPGVHPADPTVAQHNPTQHNPTQHNPTQHNPTQQVSGQPPQAAPASRVEPDPWAATNPEPLQPEKQQPQWVEGVGYVDPEEPSV